MASRSRPEVTETRIDPRLVPFVEQGLQGAQSLFQTGQIPGAYVPQFFPGQTYVGPSEFTEQAIQSAAQTAQQQSPLVQQAQQAAQSLTGFQSPGAGMFENVYGAAQRSPSMGMFSQAFRQAQVSPSAPLYQDIYGRAGASPAAAMYSDIYGGAGFNPAAAGTQATASGAYLGANPFLQGAFQSMARPITEQFQQQVQQNLSAASRAGRLGSGALTGLQEGAAGRLAEGLTGLGERLGFQGYQMERQLQEQALARQQQAAQQQLATQLSAAGGIGQMQNLQLATQLAAAGGLGQTAQQQIANQIAAASGMGQAQAQALSAQLQAAQGLTGAAQGAAGVQLQASQLAPALAEQDYAGAQRMLQLGQLQERYQMQEIQDAINRYNFQQEAPYRALSQYSAFLSGFPQGGQQVAPSYTNPAASLLGGAALVSAFNQPQQQAPARS